MNGTKIKTDTIEQIEETLSRIKEEIRLNNEVLRS